MSSQQRFKSPLSITEGYRKALDEHTQRGCRILAKELQKMIRDRIPPNASSQTGMTNTFPGYAATGQLKMYIRVSQLKRWETGRYSIQVGLLPSAPRIVHKKFWVHEFGKVIHARKSKYMTFKVQGRWVRVKSVTIKEKRFMRSAFDEASRLFPEFVYQNIAPRWGATKRK